MRKVVFSSSVRKFLNRLDKKPFIFSNFLSDVFIWGNQLI